MIKLLLLRAIFILVILAAVVGFVFSTVGQDVVGAVFSFIAMSIGVVFLFEVS